MDDLILAELIADRAIIDAMDAHEVGEIDDDTYLAILDWVVQVGDAAEAAGLWE